MKTEGGRELRLEALVLAAGAGARFGGGKLLAPWKHGLLIEAALSAALGAPVRQVTLVWGADDRIPEVGRAWAQRCGQADRLNIVESIRHAEGLSASLRAGLAALDPDCGGAFVFLGDMPRIPASLPSLLAEKVAKGAVAAGPEFARQRGHPVLFARSMFEDLGAVEGDRGAGELLRKLGDRLALVEAPDDGVLYDIDRREDLMD